MHEPPPTTPELLQRTIGCGEVSPSDIGRDAVVTGWVHRRRDLGQLVFIELRDPTGRLQLVFDPSQDRAAHAVAESLRAEFVVGVAGTIVRRESPKADHPTGEVELRASRIIVHNRAESVPFPVEDEVAVNEEARLTHRYVDLRRPILQRRLRTRHQLARAGRAVLDRRGFVELETPILTRSTPEGARDYLVPSRVHPGSFYALPQSPQLFKQLLMVAGFERYYQFARCFRDEDLRADRQPEFTQIDIELSFVTPQAVYDVAEELLVEMFRVVGVEASRPFPRLSWADALRRFGTDRPDARFGLELNDVTPEARGAGFRVFDDVVADPTGAVRGIAVPGAGEASRAMLERWTEWAKAAGAKGLVWIAWEAGGVVRSSALKVLGEERCRSVAAAVGARPGDAALIVADRRAVCDAALGSLRSRVALERGLVPDHAWKLLWVEDFPLFERDEAAGRLAACHHPFTAPRWDEVELLDDDPLAVRAQAYDLVLNGTEIGGGSIRIHRRDVQERVFRALGIPAQEALEKFGFLLRALETGAPPHGGIALGFDRICAMLSGAESIRDVIPFPKTTSATCLMTDSPAAVADEQLRELSLRPAT